MSKTFFIEDPNGTILSTDGQRRFSKLDGKAGYEFVHTAEGKGRRFLELVDPDAYTATPEPDARQSRASAPLK